LEGKRKTGMRASLYKVILVKIRNKILLTVIIIILFPVAVSTQDFTYKNSSLPIKERVDNLVSQMTLEEKLSQTFCFHLYDDMIDEDGNLIIEKIPDPLPCDYAWSFKIQIFD
jgi:hypothetical protein